MLQKSTIQIQTYLQQFRVTNMQNNEEIILNVASEVLLYNK